jgi:hypothetical protein
LAFGGRRVVFELVELEIPVSQELDRYGAPVVVVLVFFPLIARELLPAQLFFFVEALATTHRVREVL